MSDIFEFVKSDKARLRVVGVGGAGGNAVNTMVAQGLSGVEFITANTDVQALDHSLAPTKLVIGSQVTKGLGAGADPDMGQEAALEDQEAIAAVLKGADMVFVTAGMGGGTGTGAAPVIARIARSMGALTVGVVTKPFMFEGKARRNRAESGLAALSREVDSLIVIPNQQLLAITAEDTSLVEAFRQADQVLFNAVQGISDVIKRHGMINVDFADVRTIMSLKGVALMGTGTGRGPKRALEAAQAAISSPLLDNVSIQGARGVLINFTGGANMRLAEIEEAASLVERAAHDNVNLIFGAVIDPSMNDEIKITVIATGFGDAAQQYADLNAASAEPTRGRVAAEIPALRAVPPPLPAEVVAAPAPAAVAAPARTFDVAAAPPIALPTLSPPAGLPRSPLQRGLDTPLPGMVQAGLADRPSLGRMSTPPVGVAPVRLATRTQTLDADALREPAINRKAVRETGEAKMGSGFWDETSGEIDLNAPRFRTSRD
ncbi:cell division protein FtsZ [Myxococcota bacterium]|nr:cell division protein FtsZ [Myxococcota bacterium]